MPALSKAQRRCAGWTYNLKYKRHLKRYPPKAPDCVKQMWKMKKKDLEKFAKTKEKDLPEKIGEILRQRIRQLIEYYSNK